LAMDGSRPTERGMQRSITGTIVAAEARFLAAQQSVGLAEAPQPRVRAAAEALLHTILLWRLAATPILR